MDQIQNEPGRKRRRWPIVTLLLVLMSLISWWLWPRGDARFVGHWKMVTVGDDSLPTTLGRLVLKRNGSAVIELAKSQTSESAAWSVNGSRLTLGAPASLIRPFWVTSPLQWLAETVGVSLRTDAMIFEVSEIRTNEISIQDLDFGSELILTRVPE